MIGVPKSPGQRDCEVDLFNTLNPKREVRSNGFSLISIDYLETQVFRWVTVISFRFAGLRAVLAEIQNFY
ncbi:hypothetical protein [Pedobacter ginsengisoli]|uniref:hypothetical protein n=1 Tax=Pedobacter ginsengisoli TaxID=363852 RepID=UPI002550F985|nr:hypothetical protein [Pedobacter ginsengisoli]